VKNLDKPAVRAGATRLVESGKVVTESRLSVIVEHNALIQALLGAENIASFKEKRSKKVQEWRTLSIYSLASWGYIKELTLEEFGREDVRDYEISRFYKALHDKGMYLKKILKEEDLYWSEAIDKVYERGPMMVHFTMLPTTSEGKYTYAEHRTDVIDTQLLGEEDKLEAWLRVQEGPMPSVLINDDDKILGEADPTKLVLIVTEDKALCKGVNRTHGCPTIRVPVEWYYRNLYFGEGGEPWVQSVKEKFPHLEVQCFLDQGSIDSMEELLFNDGEILSEVATHSFRITSFQQGKPKIVVSDNYSTGPPTRVPDIFDIKNTLHLRS